jgi:hypothetical protein
MKSRVKHSCLTLFNSHALSQPLIRLKKEANMKIVFMTLFHTIIMRISFGS